MPSVKKPYIGCAGWNIPSADASAFPSGGSHLQRYAAVFSAVEINSSFYRSHRPSTYARWRDSVPDTFRFSIKIPRDITHNQRLRSSGELLERFLYEVSHLEEKLGCLLLQLPPSLAFVQADVADFLARLRERFDGYVVCEPRHRSWNDGAARQMLQTWSVARAIADPEPVPSSPIPATDVRYFRLHGSPEMYASSYSDDFLTALAERLDEEMRLKRQVWCVFDNTMHGAATHNALALRNLFSPSH